MYQGVRGREFRDLLVNILSRSRLRRSYVDQVLTEENIDLYYVPVFTHRTADPVRNYEWYEFLGDSTVNKCVVWHVFHRFPKLHTTEGVKVLSRLKINLVSKSSFSLLAEKLGLWRFISADEETRSTKMKHVLEDVFEAFFGVTEMLLDRIVSVGAGYGICYKIMSSLLDEVPISLKYEDLYDSVTRLKETFDFYKTLGTVTYENKKDENKAHVCRVLARNGACLGYGKAYKLDDAKRIAAEHALTSLKTMGYARPVPEYYSTLL